MKNVKNWIVATLAGALALSIVTGVVAQRQDGVTVELLVWQDTTDPERHYVSARLAGGSWRTHGTVEVELDQTTDSGRWRYGKHSFDAPVVATCASGIAVPRPEGNRELVEDCERLLELRDEFERYWYDFMSGEESVQDLNWRANLPMRNWTGVTIGGTPRRVTKLELSGIDLGGEVRPSLGDLTGLRELRLDNVGLNYGLPSKLAQLKNLTHVYLGGNSLEGCVPSFLWTVEHNDIATLGLPDCGLPLFLPTNDILPIVGEYRQLLKGGTYRYYGLVFDIPPGSQVWLNLERDDIPEEVGHLSFWLEVPRFESQDSRCEFPCGSYLGIDGVHAEEAIRGGGVGWLFDDIVESLWHDSR